MKKVFLIAALAVPFTVFAASDEDVIPMEESSVLVQNAQCTNLAECYETEVITSDRLRSANYFLTPILQQREESERQSVTGRLYQPYRYLNEDLHNQIGDNKIEWIKKRDPEYYDEDCVYGVPYDYRIHYKTRIRSGFDRSNGYCRNYQETDVFTKREPLIYTRQERETRQEGTDASIMNFQQRYDLELPGKAKLLRLLGAQY